MAKYEFALILKGQYELTEEIVDELFEVWLRRRNARGLQRRLLD